MRRKGSERKRDRQKRSEREREADEDAWGEIWSRRAAKRDSAIKRECDVGSVRWRRRRSDLVPAVGVGAGSAHTLLVRAQHMLPPRQGTAQHTRHAPSPSSAQHSTTYSTCTMLVRVPHNTLQMHHPHSKYTIPRAPHTLRMHHPRLHRARAHTRHWTRVAHSSWTLHPNLQTPEPEALSG